MHAGCVLERLDRGRRLYEGAAGDERDDSRERVANAIGSQVGDAADVQAGEFRVSIQAVSPERGGSSPLALPTTM